MTLPSGTVTVLFLDIEGSTGLLERIGEGYWSSSRSSGEQRGSRHPATWARFDSEGDGLFAAFCRGG